jgi:RNA polymerase sigma-B factor
LAVRNAIEALSDKNGRAPTVSEIAELTELSEELVLEAMQAGDARRTVSLDVPRAADESASAPMIETVGTRDLGYESVEAQLAAGDADLDERELEVLRLRFGRDMTQAEIAKGMGVSQMQISRVMRKALRKILEAVQDDEPVALEERRSTEPEPIAA